MTQAQVIFVDVQNDFTTKGFFYDQRGHGITAIQQALNNIELLTKEIKSEIPIALTISEYRANQFGKGISMCIPKTRGQEPSIDTANVMHEFVKNEHSALTCQPLLDYLQNNKKP